MVELRVVAWIALGILLAMDFFFISQQPPGLRQVVLVLITFFAGILVLLPLTVATVR